MSLQIWHANSSLSISLLMALQNDSLNGKFLEWYAKKISNKIEEEGVDVYNIEINTSLTVMKPVHAKWIIGLFYAIRAVL